MEERYLKSAVQILREIKYMTIATVCADGSPWNSPVAHSPLKDLIFCWGSTEDSIHSQNIRREKRVFVVIYDSTAPEGAGEGVYMKGEAEELDEVEGLIRMYRFIPQQIWINDAEKDDNGNYLKDFRVELNIEDLRRSLSL
ncbi:MAG: pyridoxamine 5'-phosphate oxidase family protein [Minisyncoccia bacterium]